MTDGTKKAIDDLFKKDAHQAFFAQDATVAAQSKILLNKITKKYNQLFNSNATLLANEMVDDQDQESQRSLKSSLGVFSDTLTIKPNYMDPAIAEIMSAAVTENVSLIKSIASEYLSGVTGAVMRSITTGEGLKDLVPYLDNEEGVTRRRARNIALDQTRKAYNNINKGRMMGNGIKKFEWLHTAGSQKPRKLHIDMSGSVYSFDKLPVIDDKTGEKGIPGQLVNCKCRMIPVVDNGGGDDQGDDDDE